MESQIKPGNLLQNLIPSPGAQLLKDTLLYWKANSLDIKDIVSLLKPDPVDCGMFFQTTAERFCIIGNSKQKTILVRYGGRPSRRSVD